LVDFSHIRDENCFEVITNGSEISVSHDSFHQRRKIKKTNMITSLLYNKLSSNDRLQHHRQNYIKNHVHVGYPYTPDTIPNILLNLFIFSAEIGFK